MAITECGNGHVYNSDQYSACPYCNTETNVIDFSVGDEGKTMAPGMGSFNAAIMPNDAFDAGKTVAPDSYRRQKEEENKTVGVFKATQDLEPVVGWLVCFEGTEKGKDYRLWARINTIGRSEKMDVCIKGDNTISKENHARLAYDPKHNKFNLIPAASTNNIYLNDDPVYIPMALKAYDVIELGSSKMVFIPLCSEQFDWTTGVKKPEQE